MTRPRRSPAGPPRGRRAAGGGRRQAPARGPDPEVVVDIDRLVLAGLDGIDERAVAEALESSLAELLAAPGWGAIRPAAADVAVVSVPVGLASRAGRSLELAADIARAVDGVIRGGDPAHGPRGAVEGRPATRHP